MTTYIDTSKLNERYQIYLTTTDVPSNIGYIEFINQMVRSYKLSRELEAHEPIHNHSDFTQFIREQTNTN
jgi:hypothetical protein